MEFLIFLLEFSAIAVLITSLVWGCFWVVDRNIIGSAALSPTYLKWSKKWNTFWLWQNSRAGVVTEINRASLEGKGSCEVILEEVVIDIARSGSRQKGLMWRKAELVSR